MTASVSKQWGVSIVQCCVDRLMKTLFGFEPIPDWYEINRFNKRGNMDALDRQDQRDTLALLDAKDAKIEELEISASYFAKRAIILESELEQARAVIAETGRVASPWFKSAETDLADLGDDRAFVNRMSKREGSLSCCDGGHAPGSAYYSEARDYERLISLAAKGVDLHINGPHRETHRISTAQLKSIILKEPGFVPAEKIADLLALDLLSARVALDTRS